METVKSRKQGNGIVITLAKSLHVKPGEEFYVIREDNGAIALIPKLKDIFKNVKENQYAEDADPEGLTSNYNGEEIE